MTLKNISISREIHKQLVEFGDGNPITKTMETLVDDVGPMDLENQEQGLININLDEDVYNKLVRCRAYPNESFASVIYRLLESKR